MLFNARNIHIHLINYTNNNCILDLESKVNNVNNHHPKFQIPTIIDIINCNSKIVFRHNYININQYKFTEIFNKIEK